MKKKNVSYCIIRRTTFDANIFFILGIVLLSCAPTSCTLYYVFHCS